LRNHDWRTATVVTPTRWRHGRQLGCRAEAGPWQLHTKVSQPARACGYANCFRLFALIPNYEIRGWNAAATFDLEAPPIERVGHVIPVEVECIAFS
jgi:hypothetical protein